jgi:hypothetical protein
MVIGITIASIAAGFLIGLNNYTSTPKWAVLIVVNRLGMGIAQQLRVELMGELMREPSQPHMLRSETLLI